MSIAFNRRHQPPPHKSRDVPLLPSPLHPQLNRNNEENGFSSYSEAGAVVGAAREVRFGVVDAD